MTNIPGWRLRTSDRSIARRTQLSEYAKFSPHQNKTHHLPTTLLCKIQLRRREEKTCSLFDCEWKVARFSYCLQAFGEILDLFPFVAGKHIIPLSHSLRRREEKDKSSSSPIGKDISILHASIRCYWVVPPHVADKLGVNPKLHLMQRMHWDRYISSDWVTSPL